MDGSKYDVVYLGTSDGHVLKMLTVGNTTVVIQKVVVFASGSPIVSFLRFFLDFSCVFLFLLVKVTGKPYLRTTSQVNLLPGTDSLVAVSPDEVASLPVEQCAAAKSCSECVRMQDPHCAWSDRDAA